MKIIQLFESKLQVNKIYTDEGFQDACDLINEGSQLSWVLNPHRLKQKLGSNGVLFGMYSGDVMVGTIALKEAVLGTVTGAEVGYLYITPEHRSFSAYSLLYKAIRDEASKYKFIFATTVTTNPVINKLMSRNQYVSFVFEQPSPYSSNILNYWAVHGTQMSFEEVESILSRKYITESENRRFSLVFSNLQGAPAQFRPYIQKLAERSSHIRLGDNREPHEALVRFGRGSSLPTENNVILAGNKFFSKDTQYHKLRGVVPLVPTFDSADEIEGSFIAKMKVGHKQSGQLIDELPEDPEDYIFQPLIKITSEYRVVVYFMNGKYHVSGVYKKMGSNMSMTSITSGNVYSECIKIAIDAVTELGYGLSGVDIAMSSTDINESLGMAMSKFGQLSGKMTSKDIKGHLYFLEANTMPSLSNPMILHDFISSIRDNIV